jgi:hypothetical protein
LTSLSGAILELDWAAFPLECLCLTAWLGN